MSTESKKFLFLFRSREDLPDLSPEEMQKIFGRWKAWIDEFKTSGRYVSSAPLEDGGKVLSGPRGSSAVDGPFAEAKEVVGGYLLFTAKSLDEAVELGKGCPGFDRGGILEVREVTQIEGM
jgi:hypothetical protein